MKGTALSTELAKLRRLWLRWTELIELYARRRRGYSSVDPHGYETLYRDLLTACHALGDTGEGAKREFYQELGVLVQPWLSPRVLEQADREILLDLLARCWQVREELHVRPGYFAIRRWLGTAVGLSAIALVVFLLVWTKDWVWYPLEAWLRGGWHAFWLRTVGTKDAPWWFIPAVIASMIAIVVVWRSGRNLNSR